MAEIGDRIGPFELIERTTRGRRSSQFRAVRADGSDREPREVHFRVLEDPTDAAAMQALRTEYDTLRALQDDRIPTVHGFYAGVGAIATEHLDGVLLREVLRAAEAGRVDLDLATTLDLLVEVAHALRSAHGIVRGEGPITHGWLSPDAVCLTRDGRVVVVGFGVPVHRGPAPEQADGILDTRTDQWLLGALALELVRFAAELDAGGPPSDPATTLERLGRSWPALHRVIARMLAAEPDQRYEPEDRLVKDLLAVARQSAASSRREAVAARVLALRPEALAPPAPSAAPAPDARAPGRTAHPMPGGLWSRVPERVELPTLDDASRPSIELGALSTPVADAPVAAIVVEADPPLARPERRRRDREPREEPARIAVGSAEAPANGAAPRVAPERRVPTTPPRSDTQSFFVDLPADDPLLQEPERAPPRIAPRPPPSEIPDWVVVASLVLLLFVGTAAIVEILL